MQGARTEVVAEAAEGDVKVGGRGPHVGGAVLRVLLARQARVQHAAANSGTRASSDTIVS